MKKLLLPLLLTLCLTAISCATKKPLSTDIYIDSFSEESNISFFNDIFSDIEVITLDLGGRLLGYPSLVNLKEIDGHYLIADRDNETVFLLDQDGSLITFLSKMGRGPGEYSHIQSAEYANHHIYLLVDGKSILEYSEEGEFLNQHTFSWSASDFIAYDDNVFTFLISRLEGEEGAVVNRIALLDKEFQMKSSFFPMPYQLYTYGSHLQRVSGEEEFLCIQQWPQIDKCNKGTIVKTYHLDLHGKEYPETLLRQNDYEDILNLLIDTPEIYYISDAFENSKYLLLSVSNLVHGDESRWGWWLIDKTNKSSRIEYFDNDSSEFTTFGQPILLTEDDKVIFLCDSDNLDDLLNQKNFSSIRNKISQPLSLGNQIMLMCTISQ